MTWFFILVIVWFVVGRWRRRMWLHRAAPYRVNAFGCAGRSRLRQHHHHGQLTHPLPVFHDPRPTRRTPPVQPLSRYEALKRRYVNGDLTDEQYEHEIDALLREPGGMQEI
jgi:hypothetical protein